MMGMVVDGMATRDMLAMETEGMAAGVMLAMAVEGMAAAQTEMAAPRWDNRFSISKNTNTEGAYRYKLRLL